jgi:hypothetical protein
MGLFIDRGKCLGQDISCSVLVVMPAAVFPVPACVPEPPSGRQLPARQLTGIRLNNKISYEDHAFCCRWNCHYFHPPAANQVRVSTVLERQRDRKSVVAMIAVLADNVGRAGADSNDRKSVWSSLFILIPAWTWGNVHRKKRFGSFPSPARMSLPNSPWAGIMTS